MRNPERINVFSNQNFTHNKVEATRRPGAYNLAEKKLIGDMADGKTNYTDSQKASMQAEVMINMLVSGEISFSRIPQDQKHAIFEYLYKYNPYVARVVDLHTFLPLSSMKLQKPNDASNPIIRDYIYNFFDRMNSHIDFLGCMLRAVKQYFLHGEANLLILDDFAQLKDTEMDDTDVGTMARREQILRMEANKDEMVDIIERYEKDPDKVTYAERDKVLDHFGYNMNKAYSGVQRLYVLNPRDIVSVRVNRDIGYKLFQIKRSKYIEQAFEQFKRRHKWRPSPHSKDAKTITFDGDMYNNFISMCAELGYTRGFVEINLKAILKGQQNIEIDTNPYNTLGCYIITFSRTYSDGEDSSIINRILEPAIDYTISRRRDREKANMAYRQQRLFTLPQGSMNQIEELRQEILEASKSAQGYDIFSNTEVQYQDMSLDVKDRMDYSELKMESQRDISIGLGMSDSLLAGGETYSTAFLKVELLTTEYQNFRNDFSKFAHEAFFRPIAIKRGFVIQDKWGYSKVLYPEVRFDRLSIARGSEDFNLLLQMIQQKWLPVKSLLTQLGYDYEEVLNDLTRESTTILNQGISQAQDMAAQGLAQSIQNTSEFVQRLAEALNIDPEVLANTVNTLNQAQMPQQDMMMEQDQQGEEPQQVGQPIPQMPQIQVSDEPKTNYGFGEDSGVEVSHSDTQKNSSTITSSLSPHFIPLKNRK